MSATGPGKIVVISGPSGVGKTTIVRQLRQCTPVPLAVSVSATTRPPRPDELDGVHYHFLTPQEFARRRAAGEFLECFEVFGRGYWYGTLWREVLPSLEAGKWVILGIDVHGARAVVDRYPQAITIFLRPDSMEQLEERLRGRQTESEAAIQCRLDEARAEIAQAGCYQYQVVNDTIEQTVERICDILTASGEC